MPHTARADLDDALGAAQEGFRLWSRTAPAKRAEIILKAAQIIRGRVEEMAVAMTLEQGKPIAQSRLEILRGCEIIDWDAQEGRRVISSPKCFVRRPQKGHTYNQHKRDFALHYVQ